MFSELLVTLKWNTLWSCSIAHSNRWKESFNMSFYTEFYPFSFKSYLQNTDWIVHQWRISMASTNFNRSVAIIFSKLSENSKLFLARLNFVFFLNFGDLSSLWVPGRGIRVWQRVAANSIIIFFNLKILKITIVFHAEERKKNKRKNSKEDKNLSAFQIRC